MTSHIAATPAVELRPRSIGEILALTFDLYRRNLPLFIGIAAIVAVPTLILLSISQLMSLAAFAANPAAFLSSNTGQSSDISSSAVLLITGSSCFGLLAYIAGVFWPWMEGALTHNVIERVLGKSLGLREAYRETRPRFGALWGSNVLVQLAIGTILFVVYILAAIAAGAVGGATSGSTGDSGGGAIVATVLTVLCTPVLLVGIIAAIVLAINWTFRAQVIVGEGVDGVASLGRSNELVKGHRWRIFGRYLLFGFLIELVVGLPALILSSIITAATMPSLGTINPGSSTFLQAIVPLVTGLSVITLGVTFVATLLFTPLYIIFGTVNYLDLRIRKENLAAAILSASVSDTSNAVVAPAISTPPVIAPATAVPLPMPVTPVVAPPLPTAPVDLQKLPPGQRIGALFNRLRTEGDNAHVLNDLGMDYMEIGDMGGALDALTRARAVAPADADIAFNLMQVYRSRNDMRQAKQMMAEYLHLETNADDLAAVRDNPRYKDLID